ncbi:MAG: hypothetical protein CM15mP32_4650 [Flavobacteriaceae bacterium]|nr:MAG: hypothetical protein CM15mP32_4650 [Flavobacteriaceae bacterium]
MSDKQVRHSYARIIEKNPARAVIHWRHPCIDVAYLCTNSRNWSDEYHTIYPDGTVVRKVEFNTQEKPGFQDIQFYKPWRVSIRCCEYECYDSRQC